MTTVTGFYFVPAVSRFASHATFTVEGEGFYHVYGAETDTPVVQLNTPKAGNQGSRKKITSSKKIAALVAVVKSEASL
jgi:hypothetical protein